jgi:DNA-3-methyladenine glycosylase I
MSEGSCPWPGTDPLYRAYHDQEWGVPEWDSRALWEKLVLDGFQAGLSWITILRKRAAFRAAFDGFEPAVVARYGAADVARLLGDAGIVRSRAKIEAAIGGARVYCNMQAGGEDFSAFLWGLAGGKPVVNRYRSMVDVPAQTPVSVEMSKALRARGFKFVGPVIVYAFMQATGMVNDHLVGCPRHRAVRGKADFLA